MRNTIIIISAIIFSVIVFCGCKKDESTQVQQNTSSSQPLQFKYKINGRLIDHSANNPYASSYTESTIGSITYNGTMVSDDNILISSDTSLSLIFPSRSTGSWTDLTNAKMNLYCKQPSNPYYSLGTCSITITQYGSVNNVIIGSFTGNLVSNMDTMKITEGAFIVKRLN